MEEFSSITYLFKQIISSRETQTSQRINPVKNYSAVGSGLRITERLKCFPSFAYVSQRPLSDKDVLLFRLENSSPLVDTLISIKKHTTVLMVIDTQMYLSTCYVSWP